MKHWIFALFLLCILTLQAKVVERYYFTSAGKATLKTESQAANSGTATGQLTGIIDPARRAILLKISVATFGGFENAQQESHFHDKFMETKKYPTATFSGKLPYEFSELNKGMQSLQVTGVLNLHGVQKEMTVPIDLFVADQMMVVRSKFTVALKNHNMIHGKSNRKDPGQLEIELNGMLRIRFGNTDLLSTNN